MLASLEIACGKTLLRYSTVDLGILSGEITAGAASWCTEVWVVTDAAHVLLPPGDHEGGKNPGCLQE